MPQEVEDNNSSLSIDCNENLVHEDSSSPPIKGEMDMLHDEHFYKGNVYENKFDFDNEDEVNLVEDDFFSNLMKNLGIILFVATWHADGNEKMCFSCASSSIGHCFACVTFVLWRTSLILPF